MGDQENLAFSGVQLAVTVLAGIYAGYRFDRHWQSAPWCLLGGAALGLILGLYGFLFPFLRKKRR